MKSGTPKRDNKRVFEAAIDHSSTLRLQVRGDASRKTDEVKQSSRRDRFSPELLFRIVECIRDL